jgi:glycyl-tRNA synthetase (class II)
MAFYIGKIYQFILSCGINEEKVRFRQHLNDEMAHYAGDCWDLECKTIYGWIECAGIADRCAYDLEQHSKHSGKKLTVEVIANGIRKEVQPHVIEPSFGIARIMYTLLEHTFTTRSEDNERSVSYLI